MIPLKYPSHRDCPVLDPRGKAKEGPSEDHVAVDSRERNAADGKDLEQHSSHGEGQAEGERLRYCPIRHQA